MAAPNAWDNAYGSNHTERCAPKYLKTVFFGNPFRDSHYPTRKTILIRVKGIRSMNETTEFNFIVPEPRSQTAGTKPGDLYLAISPPEIDFGELNPRNLNASRSFIIESTSLTRGTIGSSAEWLQVTPLGFNRGNQVISARLIPGALAPDREYQTEIICAVPEQTVLVPIRCAVKPFADKLELVLLLDGIGDEVAIKERLGFARQLVSVLRAALESYTRLETALIVYTDHDHFHSTTKLEQTPVLQVWKFDLSENILDAPRIKYSHGQEFEAALENALAALNELPWSPESKRVAVLLGSRPPHPFKTQEGRRQIGSPAHLDWRQLVSYARQELNIHFFTVMFPVFWPRGHPPSHALEYANACWTEIGNGESFETGQATQQTLKTISTRVASLQVP